MSLLLCQRGGGRNFRLNLILSKFFGRNARFLDVKVSPFHHLLMNNYYKFFGKLVMIVERGQRKINMNGYGLSL